MSCSGFESETFRIQFESCNGTLFYSAYELKISTLELMLIFITLREGWGTRSRSWLRLCPVSRKVAGSVPDYVIGVFHLLDISTRTVALSLTQPLTNEHQVYLLGDLGGKGGRCVTTLPPS
jgi:hypothetical protein